MATVLMYTEPYSAKIKDRTVADAADVKDVATELLAAYGQAGDVLPGLELRRDAGGSLSIAIGSFGWALVYTDTDLGQQHSLGAGSADGDWYEVRWEELDRVPGDWFVAQQDALGAVAEWIAGGTVSTRLTWSDDCWSPTTDCPGDPR